MNKKELTSLINLFNDKGNAFQLQPVIYENIEKRINMIQNDCSTGYVHIPVSEFLVSPLTFIINNFIKINQFLDIWKLARIIAIPKIQLPVELKDHRPVSILLILSKIYERVVLEQTTNIIEKKLIYHHYQSRYCKNHSTATLTLTVFTDYSKAFDTIYFSVSIKKYTHSTFQNVFYIWFLAI